MEVGVHLHASCRELYKEQKPSSQLGHGSERQMSCFLSSVVPMFHLSIYDMKGKVPRRAKGTNNGAKGQIRTRRKVTISVNCQPDEIYAHLKDGPLSMHGAVILMKPTEVGRLTNCGRVPSLGSNPKLCKMHRVKWAADCIHPYFLFVDGMWPSAASPCCLNFSHHGGLSPGMRRQNKPWRDTSADKTVHCSCNRPFIP